MGADPGIFHREGRGSSNFDSENTTETFFGKLPLPATPSFNKP